MSDTPDYANLVNDSGLEDGKAGVVSASEHYSSTSNNELKLASIQPIRKRMSDLAESIH